MKQLLSREGGMRDSIHEIWLDMRCRVYTSSGAYSTDSSFACVSARPLQRRKSCSPIAKLLPSGRELPQFVPYHLLTYLNWNVVLSVVHHELQSDEIWEHGAGSGFGIYRRVGFEGGSERWESSEEWSFLSAPISTIIMRGPVLTFPR